jgi:S1-C subfamily serine protease
MFRKSNLIGTALALATCFMAASARAEDLAEKGRAIYKAKQHVVVTVQVVIKSKLSMPGMGAQSNESRHDVTGTVLDPSGLVVLSLSATDPGQLVQNMMSSGDEARFKVETELSDIKILLDDGTELPAEVVLRDKDLDLAFIRPKEKPAAPMEALDLSGAAKVDVLDEVIALNRLGNAVGRAYSASVERIAAIVRRPRLFYIPDANLTSTTLGAPAFALDGKPVGIFVMRSIKAKGGGGAMGMLGGQNDSMAGIIVPADDILKAAKQVPAAAVDEKDKK